MDLYFLRHGIATDRDDPKYNDDAQRPLTPEGIKKMRLIAQGLQQLGINFDTVVSSPYLRARQTAEIVTQTLKMKNKKIFFTKNLLPPALAQTLIKEITTGFPESTSVLCVGHEPHLTQMISELLNCVTPLSIDFKKGGLCCLRTASSKNTNASLLWLLTPTQLSSLGKKRG